MSHTSPIAFIGLGNPGKEYALTRHNVGFIVVEKLAQYEAIKPQGVEGLSWEMQKKQASEIAHTSVKGSKVLLVKPQTFMNNSGEAVVAIKNYFDVDPKKIWVIHDDLDLPLGKVQIRWGGGTAGHHGLESIEQQLKTSDYGRIRVGIRGQELRTYHAQTGIDTNNFVMGRFTSQEQDLLNRTIQEILPIIGEIIEGKLFETRTMTIAGFETFNPSENAL